MTLACALLAFTAVAGLADVQGAAGTAWAAPDRGAKVSALIPGRDIPTLSRDNLFAAWTRQQGERWLKGHPDGLSDQVYQTFSSTAPTDTELTADFPLHISPFAQMRSGKPEDFKVKEALITYCPFCQSRSFSISYDPKNPYHGTTNCCRTELYGRERDFPPGYALKPTGTVNFLHLDGTSVEVPCTVYRDKDGVEWNLFIKNDL